MKSADGWGPDICQPRPASSNGAPGLGAPDLGAPDLGAPDLEPRTLEPRTLEPRTLEPRTLEPRTFRSGEPTASVSPGLKVQGSTNEFGQE
jgi:hypothetical protein